MDKTPADQSAEDPDLAAIRRIMASQPARTPRAVRELVDRAGADPQDERWSDKPAPTKNLARGEGAWQTPPTRQDLSPAGQAKDVLNTLLRPVRSFLARPDAPRLLVTATLAVIVVLWPLVVLGAVLLAVALAAVAWFSLGPDRVYEMILDGYWRLHARNPDRAEALRARAAGLSARLTRLLERLPDRWTQGLYLPSFEEPRSDVCEDDSDPFERLVSQRDLR
ncbi:MAG: hypothetical protein CSA73_00010 [Rhodobacterales bacterium]|nr:MAG: hypothetical protein CSA73_00010 [Rhodobacterales bacterium]